jgi:enterobactin synthetase component D
LVDEPDPVREAAAALTALFGETAVVVEASLPGGSLEALTAEERQHVASAVLKRQAEFAAGRVCARRALARLGLAAGPLLPGADRLDGVGIDAEGGAPLAADLERFICTERERAWLDGRVPESRGRWAKLIFSAKEAFYKGQYPRSRTVLEFRDVELALDPAAATFTVRVVAAAALPVDLPAARGRWAWTRRFVVTAVYWPSAV